ncbi:hypothetical protein GOB94_04830 [Granulicella sp. 5B5]|uniref:hypothetical protein n=1 Tax=Granulicella sp. 5B5 TaxID=1617967 RepID=UPI0015F4132D|nr:hypothetical protein [Granulicella sp. 5B5]QMV18091.1 hypothetical protein GOB94_04830 [Granulicella sp. 5B5]
MPTTPDTLLHPDWPEAIATVLECRYDMRAGRAIAFGLPSDKHYRIRYNYFANGTHHEGEFYSATAIPQNTLFPIRYNPDLPTDHTHDLATPTVPNPRRATLTVGIIGSIILSLAWLLILHSCH